MACKFAYTTIGLIFIIVGGSDCLDCPDGWVGHMGICYHFSHDQETWADAVLVCQLLDGKLAEVTDASKGTYLSAQVTSKGTDYWIAGNDLEEEGTWDWISSKTKITNSSYTNWGPVEPNNYNGNENCLELYHTNGKWYDDSCYRKKKFICEKAPNSNPQAIIG